MKFNILQLWIALTTICLVPGMPESRGGLVLNWFDGSAYSTNTAQMNTNLGISGYLIESFEDTTLIDGLSYSLTNPNAGTFTALPNTYVADSNTPGDTDWSGNHVLLGNSNNAFPNEGTRVNEVTFHAAGGVSSFGVALSSFQSNSSPSTQSPITDHRLFVNGIELGIVESLAGANFSPGLNRNAYLRIDGTNGDLVQSVGFANIGGSTTDLLIFDHVAFASAAVPEPSSFAFLACIGAVIGGFFANRRRRMCCT